MRRSVLLWIDLSLERNCDKTIKNFERYFSVRRAIGRPTDIGATDDHIDALCCDFDFPDRAGLEFLRATRRAHPSVPLIMLTVQHSEELAVWAFRSRVWDYLVKPVATEDIRRCYESLQDGSRAGTPVAVSEMPPEAGCNRRKDVRMARAAAYVTGHLDEKLSEAKLAALCGLSVYAFSRAFHSAFDQTFQSYLVDRRMDRARELLRNPNLRISDIARETGFRDASYFGRVFRQRFSITPSQWQHAYRRERALDDDSGAGRRIALRLEDNEPRASARSDDRHPLTDRQRGTP